MVIFHSYLSLPESRTMFPGWWDLGQFQGQVLVKIAGAIQKVGKETHSHILGFRDSKNPEIFRIQILEEKNPFFG